MRSGSGGSRSAASGDASWTLRHATCPATSSRGDQRVMRLPDSKQTMCGCVCRLTHVHELTHTHLHAQKDPPPYAVCLKATQTVDDTSQLNYSAQQ
jgi:hypothetical protein